MPVASLDELGRLLGLDLTQLRGLPRAVLFDTSGGYLPSSDAFTTRSLIGIDRVNDRMIVTGSTSLFQYDSNGANPSSDKTQPVGATANTARKLVMFKGNYYFLALQAGPLAGIWKAAPSAGNGAFSWSLVFTGPTGGGVIGTGFNVIADASGNDLAMIYVDYSDPVGGPQIWRSTDGTVWTSVRAADATLRHFHAVAQDPYNQQNVYATAGDGVAKTVLKSSDFGVTWSVIVTDANFQGVQISFTRQWIWLAGDSTRGTVFVMDRATNTCHWFPGNHRYVATPCSLTRTGGHSFADGVTTNGSKTFTSATAGFGTTFDINDVGRQVILPGAFPPNTYITGVGSSTSVQVSNSAQAALSGQRFVLGTDEFYYTAFYGIVDPSTGIYYAVANDNSGGGNRSGLFVHTGEQILLIDEYEPSLTGNNQVSAEHHIYNGYLWHAGKRHPLLTGTFNALALP